MEPFCLPQSDIKSNFNCRISTQRIGRSQHASSQDRTLLPVWKTTFPIYQSERRFLPVPTHAPSRATAAAPRCCCPRGSRSLCRCTSSAGPRRSCPVTAPPSRYRWLWKRWAPSGRYFQRDPANKWGRQRYIHSPIRCVQILLSSPTNKTSLIFLKNNSKICLNRTGMPSTINSIKEFNTFVLLWVFCFSACVGNFHLLHDDTSKH